MDELPNKLIRRIRYIKNVYYSHYQINQNKQIIIALYLYILYWLLTNVIHFDVIILGSSIRESRWNYILKQMGYKCLFISNCKNVEGSLYYPPIGYFHRNDICWEWNLPKGKIRSKYLLVGKEYPVQYILSYIDHLLYNDVKDKIQKTFEQYLST
jgi:hypothetical protein